MSQAEATADSYMLETDTKTPGWILDEFCCELDTISTTLPDSVINHYKRKSGFIVNDPKLVKIISIASQKFVSEIVNDVMQHHRLRSKTVPPPPPSTAAQASSTNAKTSAGTASSATTTATSSSTTAAAAATAPTAKSVTSSAAHQAAAAAAAAAATAAASGASTTLTLTLEDLTQVLSDYGINVKKPHYFM